MEKREYQWKEMVVMKKMVEGEIVTEGCNGKEVEEVTFVFIKKEVTFLF